MRVSHLKYYYSLLKNLEIKEDNMNKNNLLEFTVCAAITGISAYYIFKNIFKTYEIKLNKISSDF